MFHPEENPWKITSSKNVYDNPWINVTEHQVINPSGNPGIYGQVHFKNTAIGIIPLDDELNTYLVGQSRFPLNQYSWEIPEGGGPEGTDPLESAKRELLEETGLKASQWTEIQRMHLSNSVSDELSIIYLARGLSQFEAEPEDTEQLIVHKVPFADVYRMVCDGQITDSVTVAAVLKVQLLLLENRL
ncbi:NUDIX domain-containing protein [Mucilaginibacter sp. RCC_168]|uniref:NUDIX domain-containing protein n=1 Tax=Mucilaginibacter sp. RCC_168 TaxID=3239221 RepID=UPI0035231C3E